MSDRPPPVPGRRSRRAGDGGGPEATPPAGETAAAETPPRLPHVTLAAALAASACTGAGGAHAPDSRAVVAAAVLPYPAAPRDESADTHHGVAVADPWRPLEDPDAPATRAWIDAENALTESWLAQIPERREIRERLTALWDYERFGLPRKRGTRKFWMRNDGLQQQSVLWVADAGGEPRVLLDPNDLSADGTVALAGHEASPDGSLLAYAVADAGSDWNVWRVRDVATGKDLADELRWVKFSDVSWLPDGSGFFYSRYDAPAEGAAFTGANYFQKLFFHRIGDAQDGDELVYERPDEKEWGFDGTVTDDGRWLGVTVWRGTEERNAFFCRRIGETGPFLEIHRDWDASYGFLGNDGDTLFFLTDRDAPRRRIVAVDAAHPEPARWREVVPEAPDALESASHVGGRLVCTYLHDARARVRVFGTDGGHVTDVTLPGIGSVGGFEGRADDPETWFSYTGFTTPTEIWRYDVATGEATLERRPKVDVRPEDFVTEQVFCTSADGTRVPMFLTYRKGLVRDGSTPCLLTGYGGFNISETPHFSVPALVWMERGGIYASACLRGGGEYGREWHEAGTKLRKQNVFDDFIACAEWLTAERYTSRGRLAVSGGSNGGLLVGACMTQRPDLFGACLPAVGVLDMLRYHLFTIGWAWASDYGTVDDEAEFRALLEYSPLHNLEPGTCYPPTLITTGDHDDRVVPAHSFKFAAALQAAQGCPNPVLIRIETRAGHGAGKPTSKVIDEAADRHAFLVRALGIGR